MRRDLVLFVIWGCGASAVLGIIVLAYLKDQRHDTETKGDDTTIDTSQQVDELDTNDRPPSSVSSYTSGEESVPGSPTHSSNTSGSSRELEGNQLDSTLAGSTYAHFETSLTDSEFQQLLHSPILKQDNDDRTPSTVKGRSSSADMVIVQEYNTKCSPSIVDYKCNIIQGEYNVPLCPNTGTIIPDENVTRRKRKSGLDKL